MDARQIFEGLAKAKSRKSNEAGVLLSLCPRENSKRAYLLR